LAACLSQHFDVIGNTTARLLYLWASIIISVSERYNLQVLRFTWLQLTQKIENLLKQH